MLRMMQDIVLYIEIPLISLHLFLFYYTPNISKKDRSFFKMSKRKETRFDPASLNVKGHLKLVISHVIHQL